MSQCPRRSRFVIVLAAGIAPSAFSPAPAEAQDTFMGIDRMNQKTKFTISGQVAKAMMFANDGRTSRTLIVDNANETTRINLSAEAEINGDFIFGSQFEVEYPGNNAAVVTLHQGNGDNNRPSTFFGERKAEVFVAHKRYGKIWLGQGGAATDEIVEADLSGTTASGNYADAGVMGAAFVFFNDRTKSWDGPAVGDVVVSLNGNKDDRIRYDTPTIGGFYASASFTSGGPGEAALRYGGKAGPFEVAAGIGFANLSGINATVEDRVVGSASVLHESGLNLTISGGRQQHKDAARDDGTSYYGKIGYIAKLFGVGPTALGFDYGVYRDYGQNDDKAQQYSLGIVQHFEEIGSQLYLLGKTYKLDRTSTDFDDIRLLMVGGRVVF